MSESKSAIEYLMTYGWMLILLAIVAGAIYVDSQPIGQEDNKINTTQVSDFLEERTGYTDCTVERYYGDTRADATCTRDLGEESNTTFESGKKFTAELDNGSIVVFNDYRY